MALLLESYSILNVVQAILQEANKHHDKLGKFARKSATVGPTQAIVSAGGFPHKVSSLPHGGVKIAHLGDTSGMLTPGLKTHLASHGAVTKDAPGGLHVTHYNVAVAPIQKTKPKATAQVDKPVVHNAKAATATYEHMSPIQPLTQANRVPQNKVSKALLDIKDVGSGVNAAVVYKRQIQHEISTRLKGNADFDAYVRAQGHRSADLEEGRRTVVREMVAGWATSSGDSHPKAVAMQMAIRDEFKLKDSSIQHLENRQALTLQGRVVSAGSIYAQDGKAMRAFARAQYENTQAHFAAHGITHVSVFRGIASTPGATVGRAGKLHADTVTMQPASAWSWDVRVARRFGGAHLLAATVPVNRILGSMRTGFGCKNEKEIVVLGGIDKVGSISRTGFTGYTFAASGGGKFTTDSMILP